MIQPPSTLYTYHIADASAFWHMCDDSLNIHGDGCDDGICIHGVKADTFFQMARNGMCCNQPCFNELSNKPYQLDMAKEMRTALDNYIKAQEANEKSDE